MTIVDGFLDYLVQRSGTPLPALKLFLSLLLGKISLINFGGLKIGLLDTQYRFRQ